MADRATVTGVALALERIDQNTTDVGYTAIVGDTLNRLGDPVTRLLQTEPARPAPPAPEVSRVTEDGILTVSMRNFTRDYEGRLWKDFRIW